MFLGSKFHRTKDWNVALTLNYTVSQLSNASLIQRLWLNTNKLDKIHVLKALSTLKALYQTETVSEVD